MAALKAVIETTKGIDPLTLAILFIGLISLGVLWLGAIAIKASLGSKRK